MTRVGLTPWGAGAGQLLTAVWRAWQLQQLMAQLGAAPRSSPASWCTALGAAMAPGGSDKHLRLCKDIKEFNPVRCCTVQLYIFHDVSTQYFDIFETH